MAECVQVAVSNATFHFDKLYSYSVPAHLQDRVFVGSMVLVPFGRGAAARMGVVLGLDAPEAAGKRLKSLYDAAPEQARLSEELLRLVYYLKEHTFCTYYEAVKAIIPYGAQYKAVNTGPVPQLQKQLVRHTEPVYRRTDAPWQGRRTEKQQAAWDALAFGPKTQKELEEQGVTKAVLAGLVKKGVLAVSAQDKSVALYENYSPAQETIALSPAQQAAFSRLAALMDTGRPAAALLHGVTSSGKTLVFLKLIEKAVAAGRKALVLVPEISLTPQMIYRLKAFFGDRVAVQHSALSNTERLLQWQQIQNGGADIVVGTRSAVFAPLPDIGVIIIDESRSIPITPRARRAIPPTMWRSAVPRLTARCCCWPRPRPPRKATMPRRRAGIRWWSCRNATTTCRCRRCGWWTCARSWPRATHRPSAGRWRMKFRAIWPGASRPSFF